MIHFRILFSAATATDAVATTIVDDLVVSFLFRSRFASGLATKCGVDFALLSTKFGKGSNARVCPHGDILYARKVFISEKRKKRHSAQIYCPVDSTASFRQ